MLQAQLSLAHREKLTRTDLSFAGPFLRSGYGGQVPGELAIGICVLALGY